MPAGKKKKKNTVNPELNEIGLIFEKMLTVDLTCSIEFELPDSLKNWKPTEYISIKRNIYLTKRRIEDDGIFCSCCPPLGSSSACDGDCHCVMLFSTCSYSCKCGSSCLNKPFQHRSVKKLKVVETEKCGLGLVTDEDIRRGDLVIEYVGEVIDDKTCEERLWKMKRRGDTNFYLCEVSHDMVIDATYKGNKSRFINHSCAPNTVMQKWRIDGETRIGIFATRNIKRGEDLNYDYQFVQFGADQDCHCGALSCRQKLGNKPSKKVLSHGGVDTGSSKEIFNKRKTYLHNCIGELIRIWCSRNKRYYGGVILEFNSYSKEHTIAFEDERVEFVDLSKEDWEFLDLDVLS